MSIRELIKRAKGSLTMENFAKEIGISPSKLYRIAAGDISRPIKNVDLEAIVKASQDKSITIDMLKSEVDKLRIENKRKEAEMHFRTPYYYEEILTPSHVEKRFIAKEDSAEFNTHYNSSFERIARDAVSETLFQNYGKYPSIVIDKESVSRFDFTLEIDLKNKNRLLYFDVKSFLDDSIVGNYGIYESIGRIISSKQYNEDSWFYIVYLDTMVNAYDNSDIDAVTAIQFRQYEEICVPANISVLSIYDINRRYFVCEQALTKAKPFVKISNITFKERSKLFSPELITPITNK